MNHAKEAGFALIELLVALALLALAVSLMPGALKLGARAWETRVDLERASEMTQVLSLLERRIAETSALYERDRSGGVRVTFTGTSQSLSFIAPAPNGPVGAGLYRHRVDAVEGGGIALGLSLYDPAVADTAALGLGEQRRFAQQQATARFRYFGAARSDEPPQWHDDWSRTDAFPALVELNVSASTPQAARRIVVAPRLDARP